jgi:YidC/Oxa1 family membrane protein insertase
MDNQRLFLFVALSFVMLLLWQAWVEDYGPAPQATDTTGIAAPAGDAAPATDGTDIPAAAPAVSTSEAGLPDTELLTQGDMVEVETDLYRIHISTTGGDLRQVDLLKYPENTTPDSPPFRLMNDSLPNLFVAQSGLRSTTGTEPTHHINYTAQQNRYSMSDSADTLQVPLSWRSPEGVEVIKRYTFHRGSYAVDLDHEVNNSSGSDWQGREYRQLQRTQVAETGQSSFIYTYMGGVI